MLWPVVKTLGISLFLSLAWLSVGRSANSQFAKSTTTPRTALPTSPQTAERARAWRESVDRLARLHRTLGGETGCFQSPPGSNIMQRVSCIQTRGLPHPGGSPLSPVGAGQDFFLEYSVPILFAAGGFSFVVTTGETGAPTTSSPLQPNIYSLQANTNPLPNSPLCQGAQNSNCFAWVQFVYSSGASCKTSDKDLPACVFMEFWVYNYNGGCNNLPLVDDNSWLVPVGGNGCFVNTKAVPAPLETMADLPNVILSGSTNAALSGSNVISSPGLTGCLGGIAPSTVSRCVSISGDPVGLTNNWYQTEFNIFGDNNALMAEFDIPTAIGVEVGVLLAQQILTAGQVAQLSCKPGAPPSTFPAMFGATAETNNLTLEPPCCLQNAFKAISFCEGNGSNASRTVCVCPP